MPSPCPSFEVGEIEGVTFGGEIMVNDREIGLCECCGLREGEETLLKAKTGPQPYILCRICFETEKRAGNLVE